VIGWLVQFGSWIEQHPGIASWVQAVGATFAVIAAVLVPATQARYARRQREADRDLRAKSLAIAIYPELHHIRGAYRRIRHELTELAEQKRPADRQGHSFAHSATGAFAEEGQHFSIPITPTLRALVPDFYLLGEPLGPQVQKCIGRSMKFNDVRDAVFKPSARLGLEHILAFINNGIAHLDECIIEIERTWQISADEAHAFEDHLAGERPLDPIPDREPTAKETV